MRNKRFNCDAVLTVIKTYRYMVYVKIFVSGAIRGGLKHSKPIFTSFCVQDIGYAWSQPFFLWWWHPSIWEIIFSMFVDIIIIWFGKNIRKSDLIRYSSWFEQIWISVTLQIKSKYYYAISVRDKSNHKY